MSVDLTNEQLRAELKKLGASAGPITDSTRSVYLKKLQRLQSEAKGVASSKTPPRRASPKKQPVESEQKTATKSTISTRSSRRTRSAVNEVDVSDSEETKEKPTKQKRTTRRGVVPEPASTSTPNSIIPGELNLSRGHKSLVSSPISDFKPLSQSSAASSTGTDKGLLSTIARYTPPLVDSNVSVFGRSDSFGFSDTDDEPNLINKSVNTSFLPRRPLASNRFAPLTPITPRPAPVEKLSPFRSVLESLNRFRSETYKQLQEKLGRRTAVVPAYRQDRYGNVKCNSNGLHIKGNYQVKTGKQWSLHMGDNTSKLLLTLLLGFLFFLGLAYVGATHRTHVIRAYHVLSGAAKDTFLFVYTNMILPILFVGAVVVTVGVVYFLRNYRKKCQTEHKQRVFDMVEQIIQVLRDHLLTPVGKKDPYLPIPHIRDMIIKRTERNSLLAIWDEAVNYVNETESRVNTETKFINGQECMVWRWLPVDPNESADDKVWQGHAFADDQVTINSPRVPFSECLKLRGMFDADLEEEEDWPDHIQDALLEKLGRIIKVMHIAVDRMSKDGCVYMKLQSKFDAGQAYTCLHGSWFNGRLVSVKYLRTERYHERFPDAAKAAFPLQVKKPRHSLLL